MRSVSLKLSQIVTSDDLKDKQITQLHKLGSSIKRSTSHADPYHKASQQYECMMPQTGLKRKDLSLILRYVLSKEQMKPNDRNLLRRILVATFNEEIVIAGSKRFVQFLRLKEGRGTLPCNEENHFYFLFKGRGIVSSGDHTYQVQAGDYFGHAELLSNTKIDFIDFEGNYLMLTLKENEFNLCFRNSLINRFEQTARQLQCINYVYLNKIPDIARYLLLNTVSYKHFTQGQHIVTARQPVLQLYFLSHKDITDPNKEAQSCLGLLEVLKQLPTFSQSIKCTEKSKKIPYIKVSVFKKYVLNVLNLSFLETSSVLEDNRSFLSIKPIEFVIQRPKLSTFMRRKKVKINLTKSRLKTEPNESCQTTFKFLKTQNLNSTFRAGRLSEKRATTTFQKPRNATTLSKRRHGSFLTRSRVISMP